jgi:carboxymethylenebutenolidase
MSESAIEIRTQDGTAEGYLYRGEGADPAPGVLFLTDIGGIREATRELAARLAAHGYAVLVPNVFYRTAKPPIFTSPPNFADEQTRKRFIELTSPLEPAAVERDGAAYLDFLESQPNVHKGKLGVVGYCFTGSHALRVAASQPERIAAAASFHGGGLYTDKPNSPHLVLPKVRARLYFGHGIEDRSMPEAAIEALGQELRMWGGEFENEIYEGAYHGWTMRGRVYHEAQAERAFGKLTELFDATLTSR